MKPSNDNDQPNAIAPEVRYLVTGRDIYGHRFSGLYDYETACYLGKDCLNTIIDRVTGRMVNYAHLIHTPKR